MQYDYIKSELLTKFVADTMLYSNCALVFSCHLAFQYITVNALVIVVMFGALSI